MENKTTNKNVKAVVISIIVAVIAVAAILLGTNISSQASKNDRGNQFIGKNQLMLTDNKIAVDLRSDRKFDKNDWEAKEWAVYLDGYTKEAYFVVSTLKQIRSWQRDALYDIEGIYHSFVENAQNCKIPKGKTQNIPNYFESIWDYRQKYASWIKNQKIDFTFSNPISTKDRPDETNGSCVLIKVRDRTQTIYATYYIRY